MFEVGMSALVLKICSEYAKSLGLNFPPCTQQEINAICEWVDKHTIKDMTISQDGYNVTFTFKTENDTTKEFTFTIPKNVDIDELEKVLKGSDSVVVDRLADNSGLQVRISQSVLDNINSKLAKPTNPSAESAVTMLADGTVGTKPLSEIGGGGKLYRHSIIFEAYGVSDVNAGGAISVLFERYSSNGDTLTSSNFQTLFPTNKVVVGTAYLSNGDAICTIRCVPSGQILQAILYYPTSTPSATPKTGSGLIQGVDLTKIETSSQPTAHPIRFFSDTVTEL